MSKLLKLLKIILFVCIVVGLVHFFSSERPVYTTETGECYHFYDCETMDDAREADSYIKYESVSMVPSYYRACGLCNARKEYTVGLNWNHISNLKTYLWGIIGKEEALKLDDLVGKFKSVRSKDVDDGFESYYIFICKNINDDYQTAFAVCYDGEGESLYADGTSITNGLIVGNTISFSATDQGLGESEVKLEYVDGQGKERDSVVVYINNQYISELYRTE